jgi:MerR HTH family regulatory protein
MSDSGRRAPRGGQKATVPGSERMRTIGQVVQELEAEFPALSISKIRYLEDRGLLKPARTEGRYRKYSNADVRSLRTILTLQRDEYLPLEVIRQRVDRTGGTAAGRALASVGGGVRPSLALRREEPVYSVKEVREAAGVDEAFLSKLEEYRLIERSAQAGAVFTESDLETIRICQSLSRFQLEPRNLRLLASSAEREGSLIEQITTTYLRSTHPDKRDYGLKMVEELGSLFSQLLHLVLYKELRHLL